MNKKYKEDVLQAVSKYLENKGFCEFRADMEEMGRPKKIVEKISGEIIQPDMTANYQDSSFIFEIETGENIKYNKEKFLKKCNILQQHATSKKGRFYLIVPVQQFENVLTEINRNNLENVGIIQIEGG